MKILLTGGAGFIGSNLVRHLIQETEHTVINVDKLTYAGNPGSLKDLEDHERYLFEQVDLCDAAAVAELFSRHHPDGVMHLAAESHVDRSIDGPGDFIQTNIIGTFNLLQASLAHWRRLPANDSGFVIPDSESQEDKSQSQITNQESAITHAKSFRFLHVSTDEVYGSLATDAPGFSETTPYDPHSPYSASKAASDHLVRAWGDTYGLPVLVTNCSNNYGPYQFPEKLIPVVILKCLRGEPIPVYGKGENIRDWLYVEDHCRALTTVFERGTPGQTYNIGGNNERQNIELVRMLCSLMDEFRGQRSEDGGQRSEVGGRRTEDGGQRTEGGGQRSEVGGQISNFKSQNPSQITNHKSQITHHPSQITNHQSPITHHPSQITNHKSPITNQKSPITNHQSLITFVTDRPGHDMRYAIDATKIRDELGWEPKEDFESGFRKTVQWYLDNQDWWENILSGDYKLERLGDSSSSY